MLGVVSLIDFGRTTPKVNYHVLENYSISHIEMQSQYVKYEDDNILLMKESSHSNVFHMTPCCSLKGCFDTVEQSKLTAGLVGIICLRGVSFISKALMYCFIAV